MINWQITFWLYKSFGDLILPPKEKKMEQKKTQVDANKQTSQLILLKTTNWNFQDK